jgi:hypothetical protein
MRRAFDHGPIHQGWNFVFPDRLNPICPDPTRGPQHSLFSMKLEYHYTYGTQIPVSEGGPVPDGHIGE